MPSFSLDATAMGLCGGMVFTARDIFQAKKQQLRSGNSVGLPMPSAQYLLNRQVDALSPMVTTWLAGMLAARLSALSGRVNRLERQLIAAGRGRDLEPLSSLHGQLPFTPRG